MTPISTGTRTSPTPFGSARKGLWPRFGGSAYDRLFARCLANVSSDVPFVTNQGIPAPSLSRLSFVDARVGRAQHFPSVANLIMGESR